MITDDMKTQARYRALRRTELARIECPQCRAAALEKLTVSPR